MPREICPHCNREVEFAYGRYVPCPKCGRKLNVFDDEHPLKTITTDQDLDINTLSDYTPKTTERRQEHAGNTTPITGITYKHIGGLDDVIFKLDLMVNGATMYPDIWKKLGSKRIRGILLSGPPGGGKTLLAQALAYETGRKSYLVQGSEIKSWKQGSSEENLRNAYKSVQPNGILIIDELDAIAGNRAQMVNEINISVVGTLLSLLDGAKNKDNVIIIGTTNKPYMLDSALRRPGRFDIEIQILPPDLKGRIQIFSIHTAGMPLGKDIDIESLARRAHGFNGADIAGACNRISQRILEASVKRIQAGDPQDLIVKDLEISQKEFYQVIEATVPSLLRENYVEVSHVGWNDIGGLAKIKRQFHDMIELPIAYRHEMATLKLRQPKGALLHGEPGCGKTLIAKAMAHESGYNILVVNGPALMNQWVGRTEEAIRDLFWKASLAKPCIIFFDEVEAIAPKRGKSLGNDVTDRAVSQLLSEMDGASSTEGIIVMAASNRRDLIDPALLRPGRFDLLFEVPKPDAYARGEIITIHLKDTPIQDIHIVQLSELTDGFSGADIEWACTLAKKHALTRYIESSPREPLEVIHEDLLYGIYEVRERNR